jgi:exocyst complex component 2
MGKLNFAVDEASLLRAYKISSLSPTKWEEVDHDLDGTPAGAVLASFPGSGSDNEGDPLGLGATINVKEMDTESISQRLLC